MTEKLITCDNLGVQKGGQWVFRHLNAEFHAGECVLIHGRSGSGKTVLLESIKLITSCSEGEIKFSEAGDAKSLRKLMLYLPFWPKLPLRHSVERYVRDSEKHGHRQGTAEAVIEYFDLESVLHDRISTLSAGWQKRLQLVQLLFREERIWLLDHPTALLDSEGLGMLEGLMQTRRQQDGLILYTSPLSQVPEGTELPEGLRILQL
tara:strand:+ start:3022 stop:3639 length:618 start_codon:yes stop_codon:yes gene_type:complete